MCRLIEQAISEPENMTFHCAVDKVCVNDVFSVTTSQCKASGVWWGLHLVAHWWDNLTDRVSDPNNECLVQKPTEKETEREHQPLCHLLCPVQFCKCTDTVAKWKAVCLHTACQAVKTNSSHTSSKTWHSPCSQSHNSRCTRASERA